MKQDIQEESKIKRKKKSLESMILNLLLKTLKKRFLQTRQKASVCGIATKKLRHYCQPNLQLPELEKK